MPDLALANYVEAGLWLVIALLLAAAAVRHRGVVRQRAAQAATVFAVFAGSDVVEAQTGAWWRPWWLLAWKAACVLVLIVLLVDYLRRGRSQAAQRGTRADDSPSHPT